MTEMGEIDMRLAVRDELLMFPWGDYSLDDVASLPPDSDVFRDLAEAIARRVRRG